MVRDSRGPVRTLSAPGLTTCHDEVDQDRLEAVDRLIAGAGGRRIGSRQAFGFGFERFFQLAEGNLRMDHALERAIAQHLAGHSGRQLGSEWAQVHFLVTYREQ